MTGGGSLVSYLALNWLYSSVLAPRLAAVVHSGIEVALPPYSHPVLVTLNYTVLAVVSYLTIHLKLNRGNSLP